MRIFLCILHISYIDRRLQICSFPFDAVCADISTAALDIMNDIPIPSDIIINIFFQTIYIRLIVFLECRNKTVKGIKIASDHLQCIFNYNAVLQNINIILKSGFADILSDIACLFLDLVLRKEQTENPFDSIHFQWFYKYVTEALLYDLISAAVYIVF